MANIFFKNLELLGKRYFEIHLGEKNKDLLETNDWEGFKFILNYAFLRGRSDILSNQYYVFATEILKEFYKLDSRKETKLLPLLSKHKNLYDILSIKDFKSKYNIRKKNALKNPFFKTEIKENNVLIKKFTTVKTFKYNFNGVNYKKEISLTNDKDIMMLFDLLNNIVEEKINNIYSWTKENIIRNNIDKVYQFYTRNYCISDKIATLIIRDFILLYKKEEETNCNPILFFPIDTWVRQLAEKYFKNDDIKKYSIDKIKELLIEECTNNKLSIPLVNAGSWFIGYHSFEILQEIILKKSLNELEVK